MIQFLIDAFADAPFKGNGAAVLEPFSQWPDTALMQKMAQENNQAETAFLLKTDEENAFCLRWFTPAEEVKLCGHATLAAAHALWVEMGSGEQTLYFDTLSGRLSVKRLDDGRLEMNFPAYVSFPMTMDFDFGFEVAEIYGGPALTVVAKDAKTVRNLRIDTLNIPTYDGSLFSLKHLIVTAKADDADPYQVISRFFAPGYAIPEDPATGSMHCILAPIWKERLGLSDIDYYQAFPTRGADIQASLMGARVLLRGRAVTVQKTQWLL